MEADINSTAKVVNDYALHRGEIYYNLTLISQVRGDGEKTSRGPRLST